MHEVTPGFNVEMIARERRVAGNVAIDYTNPFIDQTIQVVASEQGSVSWPGQTADAVEVVANQWASLDGTWTLDGSYRLAPGTEAEAGINQMGWWGATLAGAAGAFTVPYPTLTVTFLPRPVHSLKVVGDSARLEYPVGFNIRLYNGAGTILHTEAVAANATVTWSKELSASINQVTKMQLEITQWSHAARQAKIAEFFTSIQQSYEGPDLLEIIMIEEREVSQGSLPVGNISANEVTIRLSNADRRFDADNAQSPLYQLLKANRRIRAWLGAVLPDGSTEYVPLGTYWAVEWRASDETMEASVVARDRLELLRKSTYQSSVVVVSTNLQALALAVLQDAGLEPADYYVDPALAGIAVPYAWFNPISHREALRLIAAAALAQVYCDRSGVVRMEMLGTGYGALPVLEITADNYERLDNPMRQTDVANEVIVDTQPLRPAAAIEEVYRANAPLAVPAGQTVTVTVHYNSPPVIEAVAALQGAPASVTIAGATYYGWGAEVRIQNASGAAASLTLAITGKPLTIQNKERSVALDQASSTDQGLLRFQFPDNPLVQTVAVAQQIADALLASSKDARRDLDITWRGNPALLLGDRVTVKGRDYHVIRQEIEWAGALSARATGRKVPE